MVDAELCGIGVDHPDERIDPSADTSEVGVLVHLERVQSEGLGFAEPGAIGVFGLDVVLAVEDVDRDGWIGPDELIDQVAQSVGFSCA